jgi:putative transposon-encoded protein
MRTIQVKVTNKISVNNIKAYFEKSVTKFGTGAKIDAPKEYLGKKVIVLVCES